MRHAMKKNKGGLISSWELGHMAKHGYKEGWEM